MGNVRGEEQEVPREEARVWKPLREVVEEALGEDAPENNPPLRLTTPSQDKHSHSLQQNTRGWKEEASKRGSRGVKRRARSRPLKKEQIKKKIDKEVASLLQSRQAYLNPPKTGCFRAWFDFIFFRRFNRFFTDDYLYHCQRPYSLPPGVQSKNISAAFKKQLVKIIKQKEELLFLQKEMFEDDSHFYIIKPILMTLWRPLMLGTACKIAEQSIAATLPFLMPAYLKMIKGSEFDLEKLFATARITVAVFILTVLRGLIKEHSSAYVSQVSAASGQILRTLFFEKLIESNYIFLDHVDSSFISKILLFEINPVVRFISSIPNLVASPITIILSIGMITIQLNTGGWGLLLIGFFIVLMVLINWLHRMIIKRKKKYNSFGSMRSDLLNEMIKSIKVVKLNSLQNLLMRNTWRTREKETQQLKILHYLESILDLIFEITPMAASVMLIIIRFTLNGDIDAPFAFTIISAMNSLKSPVMDLSRTLDWYQDFKSSYHNLELVFKRIADKPLEDFDSEKVNKGEIIMENCRFGKLEPQAKRVKELLFMEEEQDRITTGSSLWNAKTIVLSNVSLQIKHPQKVCVFGVDDSGIENYLLLLMGELEYMEGKFYKNGTISCLDINKSKIYETSIRENIILSSKFRQVDFNEVLDVVELDTSRYIGRDRYIIKDSESMPGLDKIKLLIARLLYQETEIYVIHNLFNHLTHEAIKRIYFNVVRKYLACRTVIYSANNDLLAKKADLILVFDKGSLVEKGTYQTLKSKKNSIFYKILTKGKENGEESKQTLLGKILENMEDQYEVRVNTKRNAIADLSYESLAELHALQFKVKGNSFSRFVFSLVMIKRFILKIKASLRTRKLRDQLSHDRIKKMKIENEEFSRAFRVRWRINLSKYFCMLGKFKPVFVMLLFLLTAIFYAMFDILLGFWAVNFLELNDLRTYVYIYIAAAVFISIYIIIRDIVFQKFLSILSNSIYMRSVSNVVNSEMEFLTSYTPSRIIYRLTKDQALLDDSLNIHILNAMEDLSLLLVGFVILNYFYFGYFAVVSLFFFYFSFSIIRRYIRTANIFLAEINKSKAKLFGTYMLQLENVLPLRFLNESNYFFKKFTEENDAYQRATTHLLNFTQRWLGIRILWLSSLLMVCVYTIPIASNFLNPLDTVTQVWHVGFSITWATRLRNSFTSLFTLLVDLNIEVQAIGQVFEIVENKKLEPSTGKSIVSNTDAFKHVIITKNIEFYYGKKHILKGLSVKIAFDDKIAIIGNEGSGRHSFIDLILGIQKPHEREESCIFLFGKFLGELNPAEYRERVMYLQGDARLFSGTLRDNIDPKHIFSDTDIVKTLHYLRFLDAYRSFTGKYGNKELISYIAEIKYQRGMLNTELFKKVAAQKRSEATRMVNLHNVVEEEKKSLIYKKWKDYYDAKLNRKILQDMDEADMSPILLEEMSIVDRKNDKLIHDSSERDLLSEERIYQTSYNRSLSLTSSHSQPYTSKTRKLRGLIRAMSILRKLYLDSCKNIKVREERARYYSVISKLKVKGYDHRQAPKKKRTNIDYEPFNSYIIKDTSEKHIIETLLYSLIEKEGKNFNKPLRKIINMCRVWLEHPDVLIFEESALMTDETGDPFYVKEFIGYFSTNAIICLVENFEVSRFFDRMLYFKDGKIEVEGPMTEVAGIVSKDFFAIENDGGEIQLDAANKVGKVRGSVLLKESSFSN